MISLPDLAGRYAIVTGANTGIGRVTAVELARAGCDVLLACRSRQRTQPVLDEIAALQRGQASFAALDLGDLEAVRAAADGLDERPIDLLINNAGLAGQQGATAQGFELAFGVNHLGHALWTELLIDRVRAADAPRVVVVASRAHTRIGGINFEAVTRPTATTTGFPEYCASKLANVLWARELAKREEAHGVCCVSLHPGVVATDIWRRLPSFLERFVGLFMLTPERGAETTLHCATSPDVRHGAYYADCREKEVSEVARDAALANDLWARTEAWIAPYLGERDEA